MKFSLKQRAGALLFDAPLYLYLLLRNNRDGGPAWLQIRNRDEALELSKSRFGIRCEWKWTSDLHLPKVYPLFAQWLFRKALNTYSFRLNSQKRSSDTPPKVSFIIGHRGDSRSGLLLKTIDSIATQQHCEIECIVVEQDTTPLIRELLPHWVKYVFTPIESNTTPYSRSWAFNVGADHASSDCLIFHDNDILVPSNYAVDILKALNSGADFVNIKRFIFYLTEVATKQLLSKDTIDTDLSIESIMQNAEGGGSVGASKNGFNKIGGFDERFIGWGGEDNEFWERAQTCKIWPFGHLALIHLWHGPQKEKLDIENSETHALYNTLSQQAPEDRIKCLTQERSPLNNLNTSNNEVR